MFMLQIMFGQSKYYVDNLSVNVKRGMRKKIEMGWLPNLAPLGYRNDRDTSTIVIDPDRFPLLRRAWELLLTGAYSVRQINTIVNTEWGFRTPVRKKSGGRPFSLAGTYRMFGNPFYAGVLDWYGGWKPGKHEPMVTLEEFNRVQTILHRPARTKPETHAFAYTGLIRCSCGLAITAEEKIKPSGRRYVYYHCTRRARPRCNEPSVRVEVIDEHIWAFLQNIQIPESVERLLAEAIRKGDAESRELKEKKLASATQALGKTRQELRTLTDLRVRELISDEEYVERRGELQKRELESQQAIHNCGSDAPLMSELVGSVVLLKKYAADWFLEGNREDKRLFLQSICSNSVLSGGLLSIQARIPFEHVEKPVDCLYWRAIVETIGTDPAKERDVRTLVACVKCLKARADARQSGTDVPPPSPSLAMQKTAPRGRASWRASRELRPASAHDPAPRDRAA
jgi:hypothetical protein